MEAQKQSKPWYKKWWAIAIFIFIGLGAIGSISPPEQKQVKNSPSQATVDPSKIPYKSVEAWQIGDSGRGMTIVIDKKHDNEASLSQLGKELNQENTSRQFAMIYIYNDDTASLYRKESFCAPGQSDRIRSFRQNWAAMYQKNLAGASYTIFTDRSCDPNAANNTIKY